MIDRKLRDSLSNLGKALGNLEEALKLPKEQDLVVEGTIQRFEYVIELMWKTFKRALEYEGIRPKTPRESVKEAFKIGWLDDENAWHDMLDSRNTTSHAYLDQQLTLNSYNRIAQVTPLLRTTYDFLLNRYAAS